MVDIKDIDKLAELSRIELSQDEKQEILEDLDEIIGYVSEIGEVATEEPAEEDRIGILHNVMRDDTDPHKEGEYTEDILERAPKKKDGYFSVKKILS